MNKTTFNKSIYINGYDFNQYDELANFLIQQYQYSIKLIKDNTLFDILEECDNELYIEVLEKTKDFIYIENVLTYLIYRLSSQTIFKTLSHQFRTTYEIAIEMKRHQPNINEEIMLLLKDKVLSTIYWDEYIFSKNIKSKRNHDFMLSVEGNSTYLYSYYYFLLLHLSASEKIEFVINNHKMDSLDDLCSYMYTNQKHIRQIIAEIKENNLVLALIASKTDINTLTQSYLSENYLDLLCLLHELSQYDFKQFLLTKPSVWMIKNYQNYNYLNSKANKLLEEYSLIIFREDMSFIDLFSLVKYLDDLYKTFVELSKSNKIAKRKVYIEPVTNDYHLGYTFNEDIVCLNYLIEQDHVTNNTYLVDNILAEEKIIVVNELLDENVGLYESNEKLFNYYLLEDKKRYKKIITQSIYLSILFISIVVGLIFINKFNLSDIEKIIIQISSYISIGLISLTKLSHSFEFLQLREISLLKKRYKKYTKKISKTKVKVTKMKYKKGKDIKFKNDKGEKIKIQSLDIVKKKVSIKFLNKNKKFNKTAEKYNNKEIKSKKINSKVLNKITLSICFYASISFINYIVFMILGQTIEHKFISYFPMYYCGFVLINLLIVFLFKKYYLKSFIFYLISIVLTLLINFI